jgi:hypothetical protein
MNNTYNDSACFEVVSSRLIVTDPCYQFDEGQCIQKVKNGNWKTLFMQFAVA